MYMVSIVTDAYQNKWAMSYVLDILIALIRKYMYMYVICLLNINFLKFIGTRTEQNTCIQYNDLFFYSIS